MLLVVILCQTLADHPADALQPVNRSEIAILTERLMAVESAAVKREAKIEALEVRLREIEHQQPAHRKPPNAQQPRWRSRWLQTSVRWESTGDFSLQEAESLGTTEPQPHRIRGTWHDGWDHWRYPNRLELGKGSDIFEYWIAPPPVDYWSDPLKHGMILGTDSFRLPPEEPSLFEAIEDLFPVYNLGYDGWDRMYGGLLDR